MRAYFACLMIVLLGSACNSIPQEYQGTYASEDGLFSIVVSQDKVQLSTGESVGGVNIGKKDVFKELYNGHTGVMISPSLYISVGDEPKYDPNATRMSLPGVDFAFKESGKKVDVYVVLSMKPEDAMTDLDSAIPFMEEKTFKGNVLYFQVDSKPTGPITSINVLKWKDASIVAGKVGIPLIGRATENWTISEDSGKTIESVELFRK